MGIFLSFLTATTDSLLSLRYELAKSEEHKEVDRKLRQKRKLQTRPLTFFAFREAMLEQENANYRLESHVRNEVRSNRQVLEDYLERIEFKLNNANQPKTISANIDLDQANLRMQNMQREVRMLMSALATTRKARQGKTTLGSQMIEAIKLVRGLTGMGLKDAKDAVEAVVGEYQ